MSTSSTGVVSAGGNKWKWICACGATSPADTTREAAREQFKVHRRKCDAGSSQTTEASAMTAPKKEDTPKAKSSKPAPAKSKPAPAKSSKPVAEKKERKKREKAVKDSDAKAAVTRLEKGDTTLIAESKKLGFTHNGPLRAAIRKLIGLEKYSKMMEKNSERAAEKKAGKGAKAATKTASRKTADAAASEPAMVANDPALTPPAAEPVGATAEGASA